MSDDDIIPNSRWVLTHFYGDHAKEFVSAMENCIHKKTEMTKGGKISSGELDKIGFDLMSVEREIDKSAVCAILFSSMAVESYIFDYAARHLGSSFTKDHVDKLNLASKWIIIPRLVTGNNIPTDGEAFISLNKLIKMRNRLVHFKSKVMRYSELTDPKLIQQQEDALHQNARDALEALKLLGLAIENIHKDESALFHLGIQESPTKTPA